MILNNGVGSQQLLLVECKSDNGHTAKLMFPPFFLESEETEMVRCSNQDCTLGVWYHLACVGLEASPPELADWYCSDECRETNGSEYCTCKSVKSKEAVTVCSNDECDHGKKFHLTCLGLDTCPGKLDIHLYHNSYKGLDIYYPR